MPQRGSQEENSIHTGNIYITDSKREGTFLMMLVRARIVFASLVREVRGWEPDGSEHHSGEVVQAGT